jgi:hypothetical protein
MTKMRKVLTVMAVLAVMVMGAAPPAFACGGATPASTHEEGAAEEIAVTGVIEDAPDRADGMPLYGITDESSITGAAPPVGYILEGDFSAYVGQRVTVHGTPSHLGEVRVLSVSRVEE